MSEEEEIILPNGFRRAEYLESTGTQYINTNIKPNSETGTYIKALCLGGGGSNNIDGAGSSLMTPHIRSGNSAGYAYNGSWNGISGFLTSDIFEGSLNYLGNKIVKLITPNKNFSASLPTVTFSASNNLHLFNPSGFNYDGQWRIYSYKVTQGTEIALNFIPCLDENNIPCMYDLVSQKPFYNSGTGTFLTNKSHKWNYPFINNNYNLPSGFKKCVYLQSDGTQWINTGHIPDNETGMYFKALQLTYGNFVPFGVNETDDTNNIAIYPPRFSNKDLYYRWGGASAKMMSWDKADDLIFHSSLNLYNSKIAKFDSEDTDVETNITSQVGTYTLPIWLFSFNLNDSYSTTYGKWVGRIYRAQITQGDALIHDYVPCLDTDNRPCMYDIIGGGTIEDNTYYNQSGGTEFAYCVEYQLPSDFIKLKYLEASGTQYIKTGYVPSNNTGLYVDAYCVIDSGTNGVQSAMPMSIRETNGNTYFSAPRLGRTSSYATGYGWGAFTSVGGYGDSRYEGYLNWLNNKKYNVKSPLYVEKVGNLSNLSFTPTFDLCLFGNHNYDGKYVGSGYRIYRAKISEGSEIVRDFVPAFDELKLKPCMYDLINNVAYYNDGEGEFLYNRDIEGTYKGFSGLSGIGNRLSGNCYHLVNALITDGNCRINLGKGIINSDISHDFRGYTTDSSRFMFGTSTVGNDYFWQGDGYLVWGDRLCNVVSNSDVIVVVDDKNNKVRYNSIIITKNANFTSNKQTSIFDVGRADTEKKYKPAVNGSKFYKWVMKKDGVIIHDYRPAVDNNLIPCVIDTITGEAFYNTLSGVLSWE
jgi:hypothetical protein